VAVLIALGFAANAARQMLAANQGKAITEAGVVHGMGLTEPVEKKLSPQFTDSQGRLLADPPASPDQLLDPRTIVMAHLDSSDPETPGVDWTKFEAHLSEVTGRKVVDMVFDNGPAQLAQIAAGKLTVVALHAADAPFLVNNYGFQPAAVLGDEASGANGNHLDLLVPPNSPINSPADLRGHNLVCSVPSSITGYRAAVALLMQDNNLRPNIDYYVTWSMGQKRSIEGIAKKEYEAAAISDDKLQTLLASGDVKPTDYKQIYQSAVIPRTTIGWFYNLKPELADKIRQAILTFKPEAPTAPPKAADAADAEAATKPLHFIAIDYKKDFELVRRIDDRFDPRLDSKKKDDMTAALDAAQAAATQP
jgi:phosphonate transport system substrate-binding protein